MIVEVLSSEDLEKFRQLLLNDIKELIQIKQPKRWLKTNEVMELLGISEVTLQNLRNRKKIPFRKLGGTCYYNAEELDYFLTNL
jgi:predicted DNA-binding transcriptional regulator AlpA